MNKTKIEWADYTWNPITGCLHGCEYCYARKITDRFGSKEGGDKIPHFLGEPYKTHETALKDSRINPYPYGFDPTFHSYRLDEPQEVKKPSNIFVVSMGDLFGDWVPDKWVTEVFGACERAPWHNYLFLTKNPKRYSDLQAYGKLPLEHWYGFTTTAKEKHEQLCSNWRTFVSIEPLLVMPDLEFLKYNNLLWAIIGAETGNRKDKVIPKLEWISKICDECDRQNIPVFMKDSLIPIVGEENMRREIPKELARGAGK